MNTIDTYLLCKLAYTPASGNTPASVAAGTTYDKLVDIKDYPDMGSSIDSLETTTLSDHYQTYEPGIHQIQALSFTINYTLDAYKKLQAIEDSGLSLDFCVAFGKSGSTYGVNGAYGFKGKLNFGIKSGSVNSIVEGQITITPEDGIYLVTVA